MKKSRYPYHNKASSVSVDGPLFFKERNREDTSHLILFVRGGIILVVKKAYARSSLEAKSQLAREERF